MQTKYIGTNTWINLTEQFDILGNTNTPFHFEFDKKINTTLLYKIIHVLAPPLVKQFVSMSIILQEQ